MMNAVEWAPFAPAHSPIIVSAGTDGFVSVTGMGVCQLQIHRYRCVRIALPCPRLHYRLLTLCPAAY